MTSVFNQIGPYRVIRGIGHGGMAVVFLADDTRTHRQVALKLVQQGTDREAQEVVEAERFGAELQRQFSQVSTHVPAVFDFGVDADSAYFYVAMEYLDGQNLSEVISAGRLPVERALAIASELCRFLEDAHRFEAVVDGRNLRSLLHLDLKPRNVRITSAGHVKVFDFGIAKALSLSRKVTRNDFGSVAYLSPERLDTGDVDASADFWALGVVLHEMLSGAPPFQAPDTRHLERLILARRPPPPLPADVPAGLQAVVARLLGPAREERYDDAHAIREELERISRGVATQAEELGWPRRGRVDEDATRRTRPASPPDGERTRRSAPSTGGPATMGEPTARTFPPPLPVAPAVASDLAAPATAGGAAPVAAPSKAVKKGEAAGAAAPALREPPRRHSRLLRGALLFLVFAIVVHELSVARAAGRVQSTVASRGLDELQDAWTQYERLNERSLLRMATIGLERTLVRRTSNLADRVIANYRTPSPTVREAHWTQARDALARALAAAPANDDIRAALRYCEGHLWRINGEAKKLRRDHDGARDDLTEAVVAFREAAELRSDWADPFVGLARTFVFGLGDVERGADAMKQAQRHGHEPTDREIAVLAEGYRLQGNAFAQQARELEGLPQQRDYLIRATEAYRTALDLFAGARSFPGVPANIRLAQRALLVVEARLAEPSPPAPVAPPAPQLPDIPAEGGPPESSATHEARPWL